MTSHLRDEKRNTGLFDTPSLQFFLQALLTREGSLSGILLRVPSGCSAVMMVSLLRCRRAREPITDPEFSQLQKGRGGRKTTLLHFVRHQDRNEPLAVDLFCQRFRPGRIRLWTHSPGLMEPTNRNCLVTKATKRGHDKERGDCCR